MEARIRLTGEMQVETPAGLARAVDFPGRQGRLTFARLALSPGPVVRDEIAEVVWPARLPGSWERDLSAIVSKLRSLLVSLGLDDPIRGAMGCYELRLGPRASVDVMDAMRFVEDAEAALARGDLRRAHGAIAVAHEHCLRPFLPGEEGPWVEARRTERHQLLVRVLDAYVEVDVRRGVFPEGRRMALQLLDLEPYRESSYAALMRLQMAAGDRADALKTYERVRTLLAEELGAMPGTALEDAYREALGSDTGEASVAGTPLSAARPLPHGTVTLVFTDIVRSTEIAGRVGPAEAEERRRRHFALLRELVAMHGGHEVKTLGDGIMAAFGSAIDAVACSISIQRAVHRDGCSQSDPVELRIGVNTGEPVLDNGDYHGVCVAVASRLCDAAGPGEIVVSDVVRLLTAGHHPAAGRMELDLKGVTGPTVAWNVPSGEPAPDGG